VGLKLAGSPNGDVKIDKIQVPIFFFFITLKPRVK